MKNPTPEQVQTVIDTLMKARDMVEKATGRYYCPVDMACGSVNPCGTPMCHAGYYALVKGGKSFYDGASVMARDLGFHFRSDIEVWAAHNPHIWGNGYGGHMFHDSSAFGIGLTACKGQGLDIIINHWMDVKDRIESLTR